MKKIFIFLLLSLLFPVFINSKEITDEVIFDETSDKAYCLSILKSKDSAYTMFTENMDGTKNLLKYDNEGMVIFEKELSTDTSIGDAMVATDDSYILAGNISDMYFYIKKINENGEEIWEYKTYSNGIGSINKVVEGKNGYIYAVGSVGMGAEWSSSDDFEGDGEAIIIIVDKDGNEVLVRDIDGTSTESISDIFLHDDGSYTIIGNTSSNSLLGLTPYDESTNIAFIAKYDKNNNMLWSKKYEFTDEYKNVYFSSLKYTSDGYYIAGSVLYDYSSWDSILIKYNLNDEKEWEKIIDNGNDDRYLDLLTSYTGKFIVLGLNEEETFIDVFDNAGNRINSKKIEGNLEHASILKDNTIAFCGYRNYSYMEDGYESNDNKLLLYRVKASFNINVEENNNGLINVDNENNVAFINVTPNDGFELDTVSVVDSAGNPVLVKTNNDGKIYYDMYDDTVVKVNFKEKIVNPKTGVISYIGLLFSMLICSFLAFWFIMKSEHRYEL